MYRKTSFACLILVFIFGIVSSCSKDKTQPPPVDICDRLQPYTYLADVKPIYDVYCASFSCHSNIAQANGVDLSDYTNSKLQTELGNVLCAIKHTCEPMPKNEPKLSDSLIQVVECWAANGFQN